MTILRELIDDDELPLETCSHCDNGYVNIRGHICPCAYCGGDGAINQSEKALRKAKLQIHLCWKCWGDGWYECNECGGSGWEGDDEHGDSCPYCTDGEIDCRSCGGYGWRIVTTEKRVESRAVPKWAVEYAETLFKIYKKGRR